MANILGSLFVDLRANTADFVSGMSAASYAAKKAGKDIESSFSRLGGIAQSALAPYGMLGNQIANSLGTLGTAVGRTMTSFGKMGGVAGGAAGAVAGLGAAFGAVSVGALALGMHMAKTTAEMYEAAKAAGVDIASYSALMFAAKQAGVEQDVITRGLQRMARQALLAGEAAPGSTAALGNAFVRLGVSVKNADGSMRTAKDIFLDVAQKLSTMRDSVAKTGLMMEIFGRSGAQLAFMLNMGAAGIGRLTDQAQRLGVVITDQTGQAAVQLTRDLNILDTAADGLALRLMENLLPALTAFRESVNSGFTGAQSQLNEFIDDISTMAKEFLTVADVVWAVMDAIGVAIGDVAGMMVQVQIAQLKMWDALIHGNISGMVAAAKEGAVRVKGVWDQMISDEKQNALGMSHFLAGVWSAPKPEAKDKQPKKQYHPDLTPVLPDTALAQITRMVAQLRAQTSAEIELAGATSQSVAAQRLQEAANAANEMITRLMGEAEMRTGAERQKLIGVINSEASAIRALTAEKQTAKDAVGLAGEMQKENLSAAAQVTSLQRLAAAYAAGGGAIASAGIADKLDEERAKVSDLGEEIDRLSKMQGVSAASLATLRTALDQVNAALETQRANLEAARSAGYDVDIAKSARALADEKPLIDAVNAAYLQSAEAVRQAQAALQAYQYSEAHPGATPAQIAAMAAQYRQVAAEQQAAQTAQSAAPYSPQALATDQLAKLEKVRAAIQASGQSILLIDAAIQSAQQRLNDQMDQAALAVGNLHDKFTALFDDIQAQGNDFGGKIFDSLSKAVDGVSTQLARLVVTGKSSFRELFQGLQEEIVKAGIQRMFAQIAGQISGTLGQKPPAGGGQAAAPEQGGIRGALGGVLGHITGGAKTAQPGSSPGNPLYTKDVNAAPVPAATSPAGGSLLSSLFGGSSGGGATASGAAGGGGGGGSTVSTIMNIAGMFAGMASGGDVTPGKAYVVGEHHPEFFVPKMAGRVMPSMQLGSSHQTTVNFAVNGVQNPDTFNHSAGQIMAMLQNQMASAYARNK